MNGLFFLDCVEMVEITQIDLTGQSDYIVQYVLHQYHILIDLAFQVFHLITNH